MYNSPAPLSQEEKNRERLVITLARTHREKDKNTRPSVHSKNPLRKDQRKIIATRVCYRRNLIPLIVYLAVMSRKRTKLTFK